jgi:hypothetical protein
MQELLQVIKYITRSVTVSQITVDTKHQHDESLEGKAKIPSPVLRCHTEYNNTTYCNKTLKTMHPAKHQFVR